MLTCARDGAIVTVAGVSAEAASVERIVSATTSLAKDRLKMDRFVAVRRHTLS